MMSSTNASTPPHSIQNMEEGSYSESPDSRHSGCSFRDEMSGTFSEPVHVQAVDSFHDCSEYMDLDDSNIPTIRLSNFGAALEQDFQTVQNELAGVLSDDETADGGGSMDHRDLDNKNSNNNNALQVHPVVDSTGGIVVQELTSSSSANKPRQRQRLVSSDGVIAEFEVPSSSFNQPDDDSPHDDSQPNDSDLADEKIVAQAVEIDASFRSNGSFNMHDLELGDEEPLPYPGNRRASGLARAARNFLANATRSASSRSPFTPASAVGQHRRAELLSATVIKNAPTESVGLNLLRDEVVVYSINRDIVATDDDDDDDEENNNASKGSLLRHCPFQAGDKILSINNKRTQHMDSPEAARMLREATGYINIVCRNEGGDPCLIESMITKANRNQRSGMGLKSTGQRDLRVSSINENGLFAQSLLNVGDRILSINEVDVTEVDARVACDIIKDSPDRVTVVARTAHTTGVVVAEVSTRGLRRDSETSQQILTVVPEDQNDERRNEIEAVDDVWELTKQQREHVVMGLCLTLLIVAVMAGIFGRSSAEDEPALLSDPALEETGPFFNGTLEP
ncbi:expressed unknown protein [Seminavis robusta]|uniref:PDZ domain-containing protein n=1 Tax=Seminavis robusta TaxID=568900 RepID=A0A9N8HPG3_9STRA|nr:expressed unknown protein [Seminavis robusta]|eukprot:Sro900_g217870.1 n/a (567) ;mRNA; f:27030-28730